MNQQLSTNLMAQENLGVFTPNNFQYQPVFFLPTTQQSLEPQLKKIKNEAYTTHSVIGILAEKLKTNERKMKKLVKAYRKLDRKLAKVDGRFRVVKAKTEFSHTEKKPGVVAKAANKRQLMDALKLMSQSDRDGLLQDLLK